MQPDSDYIACDCHGRTGAGCPVLRELRLLKSDDGRAQLRREYHEALRVRAGQFDSGEAVDVPRKLEQLGVPMDSIAALRAPRETVAMENAKRLDRGGDLMQMLVLLGPPGSGKTVAAAWLLGQAVRRHPWNSQPTKSNTTPLLFVEARALTRLSNFDPEASRWVDAMRDAKLLVLDDVGDEGTPSGCSTLADVVLHRHARKRRTVLTGNLRAEAFKARYGDALADRIRASAIVPNLWGQQSMRKRGAA
jgi:hypothetical protein